MRAATGETAVIPFALVSLAGAGLALVLLSPLGLPAAAIAAPFAGSALGVAVSLARMA